MSLQVIAPVLAFAAFLWLRPRTRHLVPLPPGPPPDPLIGHMRIMPSNDHATFFYELGKIYGDVIHLDILGRSTIVLNSVKAATDLLDRRSANYSDRVDFPIYKLMGFTKSLVFMKYGKDFQFHRRMYQQYFSKNMCATYVLLHTREACVLAQNLASDAGGKDKHFLHFAAALITRVAYGHLVTSNDDLYLKMVEQMCDVALNCGPPGGTPVDFFPFLQHLPKWFPGAYYARFARDNQDLVKWHHEFPYAEVEKNMEEGTALPSFVAENIKTMKREESENLERIQHIQGAAATIFSAGAETTSSTLSFFCLAMVRYPDCLLRAQAEIDTVIGTDRLPGLSDRISLPYVQCVMQESLRWMQAAPSGVPHRSMEDDVYNGMFIPKGSLVIANTRAMTLDETVYSDPFEFDPTRYLPEPQGRGEPHPVGPFGFGRRICPGRYFASDSLWIAMATMIATLSISRMKDKEGKDIIPDLAVDTGITCHPRSYPCKIAFRTPAGATLVAQGVNAY